jgi:hypothetical protein
MVFEWKSVSWAEQLANQSLPGRSKNAVGWLLTSEYLCVQLGATFEIKSTVLFTLTAYDDNGKRALQERAYVQS